MLVEVASFSVKSAGAADSPPNERRAHGSCVGLAGQQVETVDCLDAARGAADQVDTIAAGIVAAGKAGAKRGVERATNIAAA